MEINFTVNQNIGIRSFLQNAEYSSYYRQVLNDFKDSFPGIETVNVDFQEKFRNGADISPRENGKLIGRERYDIVIPFSTYRNNKGQMTNPTVQNVFQTIRYCMQDEMKNFAALFEGKNPILRARLKQLDVDMSSNKSVVANELHGALGSSGYKLDLDKRIWSLSTDDLYQLGRVIIVSGTDGKVFSYDDVVRKMSEKLEVPD